MTTLTGAEFSMLAHLKIGHSLASPVSASLRLLAVGYSRGATRSPESLELAFSNRRPQGDGTEQIYGRSRGSSSILQKVKVVTRTGVATGLRHPRRNSGTVYGFDPCFTPLLVRTGDNIGQSTTEV